MAMTRPISTHANRRVPVRAVPQSDPETIALERTRSILPFDVGCAHTLPDQAGAGRCQLWIGHQGEHAVMFLRNRMRMVRFWSDGAQPQVHDGTDCRCQPWVYGFPRPAWREGSDGRAGLTCQLEPAGPVTSQVVADAMVHRPKVDPITSTVADLRRLFVDQHVHTALITVEDVLIAVVDRADLRPGLAANTPAAGLGTLAGRTVAPTAPLETARRQLARSGRRRLAVIDAQQRLLGLLCLKRGRDGFCSDQDVRSRALSGSSTFKAPRPAGGIVPSRPVGNR